ncbi:MAG: MerR family DNA-binding transcriptional regulator [Hyphomicrobiales bacterium]|nr:MerR family DNA-binding transcriptional regulator [Hyphomicrobiales bacterium]
MPHAYSERSDHPASRPAADMPSKAIFTIGDLAREFDITLRTLRFYEDRGLLNPRRQGQQRLYSRRDRARLDLILRGKRVGFSLNEIKEMLDLYDLRDGQVTQMRVALGKFQDRISALRRQKQDIEEAIVELERTVEIVGGILREKERQAEAD